MTLNVNVLTLFPDMFPGILGASIPGNAMKNNLWNLNTVQIRDFAMDKHATVDDAPFGGGAGMVMRPDVVDNCLSSLNETGTVVYLTPRGKTFDQEMAEEFSKEDTLTFLCGRYEGVDQRVIEKWNMKEISIGDFVLSGGEPAVQVLLDSVIRLLPGAVGDETSIQEESFENDLLEYSHYTRPQNWDGNEVPEILLSGHHENIAKWRNEERKKITKARRPDLWEKHLTKNS
ncbi:MAG: tRNA (guanosine(37)-N1)-methyltransferase TrmD [Alphaproteobacteria bacterium]